MQISSLLLCYLDLKVTGMGGDKIKTMDQYLSLCQV